MEYSILERYYNNITPWAQDVNCPSERFLTSVDVLCPGVINRTLNFKTPLSPLYHRDRGKINQTATKYFKNFRLVYE